MTFLCCRRRKVRGRKVQKPEGTQGRPESSGSYNVNKPLYLEMKACVLASSMLCVYLHKLVSVRF